MLLYKHHSCETNVYDQVIDPISNLTSMLVFFRFHVETPIDCMLYGKYDRVLPNDDCDI